MTSPANASRPDEAAGEGDPSLTALVASIRKCRRCVEAPSGAALPHDPRPVVQASNTARIAIFSQAPGTRVHESGRPFTDASGARLRAWLGIGEDVFYDASRVAVVPMGFCFPGQDERGADLPPRRECAPLWRARLMAAMPQIETAVLVGKYAQDWHLGERAEATLTETVRRWRDFAPRFFPTPHASWRNNGWLGCNPWFERDLVPALQRRVGDVLSAE
jgi:uracil-DNA glycosylase